MIVRVFAPPPDDEADPEPEHPVRTRGTVAAMAAAPMRARVRRDVEREPGFIALLFSSRMRGRTRCDDSTDVVVAVVLGREANRKALHR